MRKIYYKMLFTQNAPLRIGNGNGEESDNDLNLDQRGYPFIPGTSLTGILRSRMSDLYNRDMVNMIFGSIGSNGQENETRLLVSDAILTDCKKTDIHITIRDGVGLDEWGTTIKGAKYDFQVVETNKPYQAVIEWTDRGDSSSKEMEECIESLLSNVVQNGIMVGARTSRGYGLMNVSVLKKMFDFSNVDEREKWLNFDAFNYNSYEDGINLEPGSIHKSGLDIEVYLTLKGSFSVRVNTSRTEALADGSIPDSLPLTSFINEKGEKKENPVIPGTAWAGTFRHHLEQIIRELKLDKDVMNIVNELFGNTKDKKNKSRIAFSETRIEGGNSYVITRNAIDRFTAAPQTTALFTTLVWQGGTGKLNIHIDKAYESNTIVCQLLSIALFDLNNGLLTVGGEASVGRGILSISKLIINGVDKTSVISSENIDCTKLLEV